jgi:hypothetical protein
MLPETNNATLSFVETGKGKKTLVCIAIDLPGFGNSQITSAIFPLRKRLKLLLT